MTTAFVFPGQGSFKPGALLPWEGHLALEVLNDVNAGLQRDIRDVMDDPDAGSRTKDAQPAIMAASLVAFTALSRAGVTPDVCAGHSLGEYTAAIAAGVYSVADGARIVQARGDAMAHACRTNPGTMAAIVKLAAAQVHELVAAIDGVVVANDNADGQIVVAGDPDAVALARERAREAGGRGLPLTVEGAFHSPAMAPAADPLAAIIAATATHAPSTPLISGAHAERQDDAATISRALLDGLLMPVRWREVQQELAWLGVDTVIEVGPGGVLAGMAKRALPDAFVASVQRPEDVDVVVAHLKDQL